MTNPERFLDFQHRYQDGLHSYTVSADETELPRRSLWPGLNSNDFYPQDPQLNPWHRHGINNEDTEALAVWRALAWTLTAGRSRHVIPRFHRDEAAECLGVDLDAIPLVRWEYQVDIELAETEIADYGFVPARTSGFRLPKHAGLLAVNTFRQLTAIDRVIGADNASELAIFALRDPGRAAIVAAALNQDNRPELAAILEPGEIFVDMAVIRENGAGIRNHLTIKTPEAAPHIAELAGHFSQAFRRYRQRADGIRTLDRFHAAIGDLLTGPVDWKRLQHADGPATDTPGHLHALEHGDPEARDTALNHLEYSLLHGNFPETATAPAVQHLTTLLAENRIHPDDLDRVVEFIGDAAFSVTWLDGQNYQAADLPALAETTADAYPVILALTEARPTALRAFNLCKITQLPQLTDRRSDVIARLHRWAPDGDGSPEQWLYCLGMLGADVRDRLDDPDPAIRLRAALIHADDPRGRAIILDSFAGPLPLVISRSELVEAAIEHTSAFDEITDAACTVAAEADWTGMRSTWGALLAYAFPTPYEQGHPLTPPQRAYLRALAGNNRLWDPRNSGCSLAFRDAGLPYDQQQCRRIADSI